MSACSLFDAGSPVGGGGGGLDRFPEGGTRAHFSFLITAHLLGIHAWKQMYRAERSAPGKSKPDCAKLHLDAKGADGERTEDAAVRGTEGRAVSENAASPQPLADLIPESF